MLPKSQYMALSKKDKQKVKNKVMKGSGAYIYGKDQPFGHYGEKIGKYLSPFAGSFAPLTRYAGAYGGHAIGKLFGSGAYRNQRGKYIPSYKGSHKIIRGSGAYDIPAPGTVLTNSTSPPSFGSNRTIVKHREFIGNILSSTTFDINVFNVNPGDETTFPWLSAIAANYEKYRPIGICFEFKSTSANALNSTNTALGTVMLAPRYNAITSSIPQSKLEMLQIENCISACPAESTIVGIECAKNYNPLGVLYNRTSSTVTSGSEQFYDFCDLYIATEGMQAANVTIGELWVTYEIELLTPILSSGQVGDIINFSNYEFTTGISTSAYFGTNASSDLNVSNMVLTLGTNTITFPENIITGCYMIVYSVLGDSTASTAPTTTYTTNCTALAIFVGNTASALNGTGTVVRLNKILAVEITGPSAVITFSGGTLPTNPSRGQLIVTQIPQH